MLIVKCVSLCPFLNGAFAPMKFDNKLLSNRKSTLHWWSVPQSKNLSQTCLVFTWFANVWYSFMPSFHLVARKDWFSWTIKVGEEIHKSNYCLVMSFCCKKTEIQNCGFLWNHKVKVCAPNACPKLKQFWLFLNNFQ